MKQLLADYGLVWLGSSSQPQAPSSESGTEGSGAVGTSRNTSDAHDAAGVAQQRQETAQHISPGCSSAAAGPALSSLDGAGLDQAQSRLETVSRMLEGTHVCRQRATGGRDPAWLSKCVQELQTSVKRLNTMASEGSVYLVKDSRTSHSTLKQRAKTVPLVVWKDGLQLHTQPWVPWESQACTAILHDVLDGVSSATILPLCVLS